MNPKAALLPPLVALLACTPEPRQPYSPPPLHRSETGQREPDADELRRLRDTAEVVVVGKVEQEIDEPRGLYYQVRIQEILAQSHTASSHPDHPYSQGAVIKVSSFLFRQARPMATIGRLEELSRYLFFLSPATATGEWLNLDDSSGYMLPEAQPTLDSLRELKRAEQSPPG